MASERISIQIPSALRKELRRRARLNRRSESDLIREALRSYIGNAKPRRSAYDVWQEAGLIGKYKGLPKDLSTNPKYLAGFGRGR